MAKSIVDQQQRRLSRRWLFTMLAFMIIGIMGQANPGTTISGGDGWRPFTFLTDPFYNTTERILLIANVVVALGGLAYAWMLVKEVRQADIGTERMQFIARAVRE